MHYRTKFTANVDFIEIANNIQTKLSPSNVVAMTKKYPNFSRKSAIKQQKLLKTSQYMKLCKGDMNHRPKTAKINLGLNHRSCM